MTVEVVGWTDALARLADELRGRGKLTDPRWEQVFRVVPRHVLVPEFLEWEADRRAWRVVGLGDTDYLERVYSNVPLCTDGDADGRWLSSTTTPGLMVRMLELLRIGEHDRVLEIGTGTGYNTALLAGRVGSERVVSLDVDYVDSAREKLDILGLHPTVIRRDGREGAAESGPYDRILSTVAVRRVPDAWVSQLAPGGRLLADLKIMTSCGNLVLLTTAPDGGLSGRFDSGYAAFMGMRHAAAARATLPRRPDPEALDVRPEPTRVPARIWEYTLPWFLAGLRMPEPVSYGLTFDGGAPCAAVLFGSGSQAEVEITDRPGEPGRVRAAGPHDIWAVVESAWNDWQSWGEPGWDRFGLTVAPGGEQTVWFDDPDSTRRWALPAVEP